MVSRELTIGAVALILVALVTLGLHERHYRERRWEVWDARLDGVEGRLRACERILTEERTS